MHMISMQNGHKILAYKTEWKYYFQIRKYEQKWTEELEDLLWVCERSAKLIAVLELFEYVMSW